MQNVSPEELQKSTFFSFVDLTSGLWWLYLGDGNWWINILCYWTSICSNSKSAEWYGQQSGEDVWNLACWAAFLFLSHLGTCTGWVSFPWFIYLVENDRHFIFLDTSCRIQNIVLDRIIYSCELLTLLLLNYKDKSQHAWI